MRLDHFGWIAPWYDRIFGSNQIERWNGLLKLPVKGRVLDAGGGTGRVAEMIQCGTCEVFVADLSMGMLREAGKKTGLHPVCSQTEDLPFDQQSFERIVIVDALHHVLNQEKTLLDLFRVLKAGGRLVIEEPDIRKFGVKILAVSEKILMMRSHFISPVVIASVFEELPASVTVETEGSIAWVVVERKL